MKSSSRTVHIVCSVITMLQITARVSNASSLSQFSSHISVNTPARSYAHGVGDPISVMRSRSRGYQRQNSRGLRRIPSGPSYLHSQHNGYPREKPMIPFYNEDIPHENSLNVPWQHHNFYETPIAVLPPSPYKVDSPDPESLWPEGLFVPPIRQYHFGTRPVYGRRSGDSGEVLSDREQSFASEDPLDPYLLEGSEAIAAVARASEKGELYFHLIPHIESLLSNQKLRVNNKLKPHRIASIRHTWPYNRP